MEVWTPVPTVDAAASRASAAFLAVSPNVVVRLTEVVAIVDHQAMAAAATREFLGFSRRRGQSIDVSAGQPAKSAVICRERVFLSPFSSATLRRRMAVSRA